MPDKNTPEVIEIDLGDTHEWLTAVLGHDPRKPAVDNAVKEALKDIGEEPVDDSDKEF